MSRLARAARSRALAWGIVAVAALAYPLAVLAGGGPSFPERSDCVAPVATHDGEIELAFGYYDSIVRAEAVRARIAELGYAGAEVLSDGGCGRVKVVVGTYPTLAGARDAVAEARSVGLRPTLEQVE
jgi:hypothetical protein